MTPEAVCSILMTYNTMSGISLAIGFIIILICVLRNETDNSDYTEEYEEYDEVEEHDEYWWR